MDISTEHQKTVPYIYWDGNLSLALRVSRFLLPRVQFTYENIPELWGNTRLILIFRSTFVLVFVMSLTDLKSLSNKGYNTFKLEVWISSFQLCWSAKRTGANYATKENVMYNRFIYIYIIDIPFEKFGYKRQPLATKKFLCVVLLIVKGTQCTKWVQILYLTTRKQRTKTAPTVGKAVLFI